MLRVIGVRSMRLAVCGSHALKIPSSRAFSSGAKADNIWNVLRDAVQQKGTGDSAAVVSMRQEDELSHRKLLEASSCFAGGLVNNLGYSSGDKLAMVLGSNSLEHLVAMFGAAMAGVSVVSAKDPSAPHLEGCRGLIVSADVLGDRAPQGLVAGEKHPPIVAHDDWGVGSASVALFYDAFVDTRPLALSEVSTSNLEALAYFTPETPTSHLDLLTMANDAQEHLHVKAEDSLCLPIPVAHPFGFGSGTLAVLLAGGGLVLPASKEADDILQALEEQDATLLYSDSHIHKAFREAGLEQAPQALRGGLCKVGSGTEIGLGDAITWSGVSFSTIGRP